MSRLRMNENTQNEVDTARVQHVFSLRFKQFPGRKIMKVLYLRRIASEGGGVREGGGLQYFLAGNIVLLTYYRKLIKHIVASPILFWEHVKNRTENKEVNVEIIN